LAAGVALTALVWEVIGRTHVAGTSWAPLSAVIAYAVAPDHRRLLLDAVGQTGAEAGLGFLLGSAAGIALAAFAAIVPALARGLNALASLINGVPIVAVAGVCVLTLPRNTTPVVVAALAVGFIVFVATASGLGAAVAAQCDLFAVLGASRWATFARLSTPSALPAIVDGLRSAAPSAIVGAIVGEWFAAERGLGPLLVAAMQNYAIDQLWAVALAGALLSMVAYGLLGVVRAAVERRLT
jgi:NitT/TauT family transport system permease protein